MSEQIRTSPAATRNQAPILAALLPRLPSTGVVLEVASGSGQHIEAFAAHATHLQWQPSDPDPAALASIEARVQAAHARGELPNLRAPVALDVHEQEWPLEAVDFLFCANMLHISPWTATVALFAGAARLLQPGSQLFLYGPYLQKDVPTASGNVAFDADLRARNPEWGIRDLDEVISVAREHGFRAPTVVPRPANNLSVIYERGNAG